MSICTPSPLGNVGGASGTTQRLVFCNKAAAAGTAEAQGKALDGTAAALRKATTSTSAAAVQRKAAKVKVTEPQNAAAVAAAADGNDAAVGPVARGGVEQPTGVATAAGRKHALEAAAAEQRAKVEHAVGMNLHFNCGRAAAALVDMMFYWIESGLYGVS